MSPVYSNIYVPYTCPESQACSFAWSVPLGRAPKRTGWPAKADLALVALKATALVGTAIDMVAAKEAMVMEMNEGAEAVEV